ncbi:flagellar hook-length control protein FliK [Sporosarcina jeotgali]|uniref:Flagellar hook-length control protein FliK n=1 Tax=Sporosarcina jeotgali TaxID=3020056 RepID=A0ABZ0KY02_9BACL|nr:flagellar hook-length control protein FliK [Sporosarcina sp. B2O-1]WOV85281.1 flagellar hook-length control protein FliK [Sporosarcina sp. B2O-1]
MNIGSVPLAMIAPAAVPGDAVQTSGTSGGVFGSVLAGMTKNAEIAKTAGSVEQLGSLTETISDIFSAANAEELAASLEELTQIPQDDILISLGKLGQASQLEDWAKALEMDPAELMETISAMLEEAGVSKEELAEVMYSNDLWTLLSAVDEHASKLSKVLEEMLNSKDQKTQQQATNVLALLKTVETTLPTKDLLGWQQASLTQLSGQLEALQKVVGIKDAGTEVKFSNILTATVSQLVTIPQTAQNETRIGNQSTQNQTIFDQVLSHVTNSSTEQGSQEGKSEQNQSQILQNSSVQPIVSRNVFSLETPETKPNSQSEALLAKLQGLFKQTNFGQQGGTNRLLVKLNPEQLGQIRIELIQINGVMTARILASTALGKEMLDSQLHQLRQSFNQQNIQVDRIDVTQAVQDPSRNDRSQNFNHQQFKGNDDQQGTQEHEQDEQQSFQEYLLDVEV